MTPVADARERLVEARGDALAKARGRPRPSALVSVRVRVSEPIPDRDWLSAFAGSEDSERFYWSHPASGTRLLALGCARSLEAFGPGPFGEASKASRELWAQLRIEGDAANEAVGVSDEEPREGSRSRVEELPPSLMLLLTPMLRQSKLPPKPEPKPERTKRRYR